MTQQTIRAQRTQRQINELSTLMAIIARAESTRLCAVCNLKPTYLTPSGDHSMTCDRMQCKRAWILREPWRCEICKSLDFERVNIQASEEKVKLYHCGWCKKTYAIRGRVAVETAVDAESGEEEGEE